MAETKINANQLAIDGNSIVNTSGELTLSPAVMRYLQDAGVCRMNTQTVADATDLLALTGSLHALDLDLSSNTKLTKLTASGTSGSLANLSSVLVSNVAPFDNGTSPQLDVSYSALNRTALVNLFNSMPYNVGYETVGSPTPTITNGVASFSGSGRLRTSIDAVDWADINSLEIVTKIKTGEDVNIYSAALDYPAVSIYTGGGATVLLLKFSDETAYQYVYARNTEYLIRFVFENNTASFYVNDVLVKTFDNVQKPSISSRQVYYGQNPTGSLGSGFIGTIDLNNTYINVNGVPWFTGKAAATKTCDVRGCTGTADLTADDKAIATGKGWALTVA